MCIIEIIIIFFLWVYLDYAWYVVIKFQFFIFFYSNYYVLLVLLVLLFFIFIKISYYYYYTTTVFLLISNYLFIFIFFLEGSNQHWMGYARLKADAQQESE